MKEKDFHEMESGQKILKVSSGYEVPFTLSKEEALARLKTRIANGVSISEPVAKRGFRKIYLLGSAAAIILLFIGIRLILNSNHVTRIVTDKGKHIEYQLPDGSEVSINAQSTIIFSKSKFTTKRYLTLKGEAFFKVKKGKTFTIHTLYANVKVLGTSFDVLARENNFKVSCLTGKVLVYSDKQSVIIFPGQSIALENNTLLKYDDKNIEKATSWRMGRFYFKNTSLNLVFKELERQFNVNVVLPEGDNKFFTGEFNNKNLADALDIICIPMDLTYEIIDNNKIIIRRKEH